MNQTLAFNALLLAPLAALYAAEVGEKLSPHQRAIVKRNRRRQHG